MVKLATARECRAYSLGSGGGEASRNRRWEYVNAGVYVFAAVLLVGGFLAQLWPWAVSQKIGLAVAIVGLLAVVGVNAHDLLAHLAGVDYNLGLVGLDTQFALVELTAPAVQLVGAVITLVALIFFEIQVWTLDYPCTSYIFIPYRQQRCTCLSSSPTQSPASCSRLEPTTHHPQSQSRSLPCARPSLLPASEITTASARLLLGFLHRVELEARTKGWLRSDLGGAIPFRSVDELVA
jgi:hypothetical protein